MTLYPHTSSHLAETDAIPIVAWQDANEATPASAFPDWQRLIGALVEIRRDGRLLRVGLVDNATPSGDIVWIAADGINSRTMIQKTDGYDLSIAPSRVPPGNYFREEVT